MKRVLLTGMSGTGTSTTIRELAARGHQAVDADEPGWSKLVDVPGDPGISPSEPGQDWLRREDRIPELLSTQDAGFLFVSGCATNQAQFHPQFCPQFDHVPLSAPMPVMIERLAARATSGYGKHPNVVRGTSPGRAGNEHWERRSGA